MGLFDKNTVAECDALFRAAEIKAIDKENLVFNLEIAGILHGDVPVHYHCSDGWKTHSHPHTPAEQTQMMAAFAVDDQVLVMCDEDGKPLYVKGFLENLKACFPIIALFKQVGENYDWWFYDLNAEAGYHEDPGVAFPAIPQIITKWWSCEGLEVAEYYTKATPTLQIVDTAACLDACGLAGFDDEACCEGSEPAANDLMEWHSCPCGGDWDPFDSQCSDGVNCPGMGDPIAESIILPGVGSSQNRTGNYVRSCPLGMAYGLVVGPLQEIIEVGPRIQNTGSEGRNVCSVSGSTCGPYVRNKRCCEGWNEDTLKCDGMYDPYGCGDECNGIYECTGWTLGPPGAVWRWSIRGGSGEILSGGCIEYEQRVKTANYSTETCPLVTKIAVGERQAEFVGFWDQYISVLGAMGYTRAKAGYSNNCQSCTPGILEEDSYNHAGYSFSEQSFGAGGWRTVVTSDGRFAVLIPQLDIAVEAETQNGNVSGSIISTTTMLFRIVDDDEHEYEMGEAGQNYTFLSLPETRSDLGIAPNCYPRANLPYGVDLVGFHWHETHDQILLAFIFNGEFQASLFRKEEGAWVQDELAAFRDWVGTMGLTDHTMFLS